MTSLTKTTAAVLAALTLTATATACTSGNSEPAPTTTSTEQPALSGVGPAGRSPGQQATEGAIAAVKGMHKARATIENDPRADINGVSQYLMEPYLGLLKADMELRRSRGIAAEGEITVVRTTADEVEAPADEKGSPVRGEAEVLLRTCEDISQKKYIGAAGEDLNRTDLPDQVQAIYRVVNKDWPAAEGWRVMENTLTEQEPCDAY